MMYDDLFGNEERRNLEEWNFVKDMSGRALGPHLWGISSGIYASARFAGSIPPFDARLVAQLLAAVLSKDPMFRRIVRDKTWIRPNRIPLFADMVARCYVSENWDGIRGQF